jgi:tetratricopeptide (TPR) repeat protein
VRSAALPQDYVDRDWILHQVREWSAEPDPPTLLVTGPLGSGKSVLAQRLSAPADDPSGPALSATVAYAHFCRAQDDATLSPLRFVERLATAVHRILPRSVLDDPPTGTVVHGEASVGSVAAGGSVSVQGIVIESMTVADASARLAYDRLIRSPLERAQLRGVDRPIVLVDALDEALGFSARDNLVDLLKHASNQELGPRFLVTARSGDVRILDRLGSCRQIDLVHDLVTDDDQDLFRYVHRRLSNLPEPDRTYQSRRVVKAAHGSFLYARYVTRELQAAENARSAELPVDMSAVYRSSLRREIAPDRGDEQWRQLYRPLLGLLAVSRGSGLTPNQLASVLGRRRGVSEVMDALWMCGPLVERTGAGDDSAVGLHIAFREFLLTEKDLRVYPEEAHRRLAQRLLNSLSPGNSLLDYAAENLADHLLAAGMLRELVDLSRNGSFRALQSLTSSTDPWPLRRIAEFGLRAALALDDAESAAALMLTLSSQQVDLEAKSPLGHLATTGVSAAVLRAGSYSRDVALLWQLHLVAHLVGKDRHEDAEFVYQQFSDKPLPTLAGRFQRHAAFLLPYSVALVDRGNLAPVAARLLGDWALKHLVSHLMLLDLLDDAWAVAARLPDYDQRYRILVRLAETGLDRGRPDDARRGFEAIAESASAEYPMLIIFVERAVCIAYAFAQTGNLERADEILKELSTRSSRTGEQEEGEHRRGEHWTLILCGAACAASRAGEDAAAERLLGDAGSTAGDITHPESQSWAWLHVGRALVRTGRRPEARVALSRAKALKPDLREMQDRPFFDDPVHDDPFHGPCLQGLCVELARALMAAGDLESARGVIEELHALGATECPELFLNLARAYRGVGNEPMQEWAVGRVRESLGELDETTRLITRSRLAWLATDEELAEDLDDSSTDNDTAELAAILFRTRLAAQDDTMVDRKYQLPKAGTFVQWQTVVQEHEPNRLAELLDDIHGEDLVAAEQWSAAAAALADIDPGLAAEARSRTLRILTALEPPARGDDTEHTRHDGWLVARQLTALARGYALLGDHEDAIARFDKAESRRFDLAFGHMAFQAMAEVPFPTLDKDLDSAKADTVEAMCNVAAEAWVVGHPHCARHLIEKAGQRVAAVENPYAQARLQARIGRTAAALGMTDLLPDIVDAIELNRPVALTSILLAYCDSGARTRPVPEIVIQLFVECCRTRANCLRAMAGLAWLYPEQADVLAPHLTPPRASDPEGP